MFPKEKQEMEILDENLNELDATVKNLENELLLKKKQFASPGSLSSVDNSSHISSINNKEDFNNSPMKETRIVNKNELDSRNFDSIKEKQEINEKRNNENNYISERHIENNVVLSRVVSTNISPKRSKNLINIEQSPESSISYSDIYGTSPELNPIQEKGVPLDLRGSVPIQIHQPPQIPLSQSYPQPHQNPMIVHPIQMPPHGHGAQLQPIPMHKQPNEYVQIAPQIPVFHSIHQQEHYPPQMQLNGRMQSLPATIQTPNPFPYQPHHQLPMPPVPPQNMQIPVPMPMQMPIPAHLPTPMPMPMPVPMPMPMQMPMPMPMVAPGPIQIPNMNMNPPHLPPPPNMQMQFDPTNIHPMGMPLPTMAGGPPPHIQAPISPEIVAGVAPGIPGPSGVQAPNVPNPLGMDSQMLAKYLLTAMAEECLTKKKSSGTEDGNGPPKDQAGISQGGHTNISTSTLFQSPNIRPLIQPPKVEIDFSSPACFSQDVFKKKCKRRPKMANPNYGTPLSGGQCPFPDQAPILANQSHNPELEANTDQQSQISPPSSPTCFSFKASVPVNILGENPFSESITKIVTNKASQSHPNQYMSNGNFNIKSGLNLPIHPPMHH
ncbi:unnamed protein product [Cryptosporidium hominis]|uniref:Uncharacterized protein n=1 Tax=Cryptosporidium hominis TaxID=237895 RepID=A0A0S4TKT3_CRYHO|nr:hypothetical protein [Cryptosporidium hominis TU502]OLQ19275.1 hypothetical protein ChTU502y2012_421g0170 [Cryptosporidium hominis]PPA63314.1 hypothetical protein ChUKH1_09795 [Cryptosporidium hominis]PPS98204.1 Uncharacterized protein GY17_00000639 [Cryptosporidium hominis]CUV07755.1 unnamed protein product [Cryptosporidium hominis]|eukprot:PPS98204.1 Uncharacterized protein GY17_00000639 [Cryptosporidium hominis]